MVSQSYICVGFKPADLSVRGTMSEKDQHKKVNANQK